MHDYTFEELGPRAFEQLVISLASHALGTGIDTFGSGPDGGREATYRGEITWGAPSNAWRGYTVIQVKQKERLEGPAKDAAWLWQQISSELDKWLDPESRRAEIPGNLLIVSNVRLSPANGGGLDTIGKNIKDRLAQRLPSSSRVRKELKLLRNIRVWHRDQLVTLLNAHQGVRAAFPGMLTAGDLLTVLGELGIALDTSVVESILLEHASNALTAERWIRFGEAGGNSRVSLEEVVVDLNATDSDHAELRVLRHMVERSDCSLRASLWVQGGPRHLVVTGQPGSGKSTTSRFVTQLLRSHFLAAEALTTTARAIADESIAAAERAGVPRPRNRRWPIHVSLPEYADDIGPEGDKDLTRWISERVSARAGRDIKPYDLTRWMTAWPSLVVLDGLDEVTSPEVRFRVLDEINTLVEKSDLADTDTMFVITTRPTGYTERILPQHFGQVDLAHMSHEDAVAYGRVVTALRLADNPDLRDSILEKLASQDPETPQGRLMKTPLQVLIMTHILENFGVLPTDRYQLFWRYFETILAREAAKTTTLQRLLTEQKRLIIEVHELAGLELQNRSESSGDARSLLAPERFRSIVEGRLLSLGYQDERERTNICERVIQTATDRLVLLCPGEDGSLTFELRSLQELMAARALSRKPDLELADDLLALAPSPHWRNTWLFVAGQAFAEGSDTRRAQVVTIVESCDTRATWPSWLCPAGPPLAAALLEDGMAGGTPDLRRRLLAVALRALATGGVREVSTLGSGLAAAAKFATHRTLITSAVQDAERGTAQRAHLARAIAAYLEIGSARTRTRPHQARTYNNIAWNDDWNRVALATILEESTVFEECRENSPKLIDQVLSELRRVHFELDDQGIVTGRRSRWSGDLPATLAALTEGESAEVLQCLFGGIASDQWRARDSFSRIVASELGRRPHPVALPST